MKHTSNKILILCLCVLAFCKAIKAQDTGADTARAMKFEMGSVLYSLENRDDSRFFRNDPRFFEHQLFNGLYLKLWKGNRALRLQYSRYTQANDFPEQNPDIIFFENLNASAGSLSSGSAISGHPYMRTCSNILAGVQYVLTETRLAPYCLADLSFLSVKEQGMHVVQRWNGPWPYDSKEIYTNNLFDAGLSAGLGLRLQVSKNIVLNYEFQTSVYYQSIHNRRDNNVNTKMAASLHPAKFTMGLYF